MSRIRIAVATAVVAASFVAAPAAQASAGNPLVEKALWAVKCAGDALGGNACHQ